jgi:hypothetical protein
LAAAAAEAPFVEDPTISPPRSGDLDAKISRSSSHSTSADEAAPAQSDLLPPGPTSDSGASSPPR